jgi:hypothetical protein
LPYFPRAPYTQLKIWIRSPDKNPGVKNAPERFARLGVIANILRNKASRKRYVSTIIFFQGPSFYHDYLDTTSFIKMVFPGGGALAIIIHALDLALG